MQHRINYTDGFGIQSGDYEEFRDASNNVMRRLHYINSPYGLVAVVEKTGTNYDVRYVMTDYLGSICAVTDDAGTVLQQVSFDAWGRRRDPQTWALYGVTNAWPSALYFGRGYTGHEHLEKFDLINMNGRMYDPTLCRMLSVDNYNNNVSSTNGMNRYAYALNNPLKYTDPSGHVIGVDDIIIGAVVGGIINVGIQGFSGNINSFGDLGTAFGIGALAGAGGAFVGGAVAGAAAGAAGTSNFAAGAITGSASGFASGFIGGAGNSWMNGSNFGQGLMAGVEGGAAGAITGGIIGGGLETINELTSNTTESGDLLACNCGGGGGGGNGGKGPKTHVSKRRLVDMNTKNLPIQSGKGNYSSSTGFIKGFNQSDVDFAGAVGGGLGTVFGSASHYSNMIKAAGKIGLAGNVVTYGTYIHAYTTNQAKPSHHLDAAITTTILGLTLFPGTTWIGVPMGFIYGGARLIGGEAFDNLFNNQFAPAPVLTPNRVKP